MRYRALDLSRRPFRNARPVWRVSIFLWLVGAGLLAANTWLFWDFLSGKGATGTRLEEIGAELRTETTRMATLKNELERFDLRAQNEQVAFLNEKIVARLFSWSGLFEDLVAAMPDAVRLERLSPKLSEFGSEGGRNRGREVGSFSGGRVLLKVSGYSRTDEALLAFLDSLFAHPGFESPKLMQESTDDSGQRRFNLEVTYRPTPESLGLRITAPVAAPIAAPIAAPTAAPVLVRQPASSPPVIR